MRTTDAETGRRGDVEKSRLLSVASCLSGVRTAPRISVSSLPRVSAKRAYSSKTGRATCAASEPCAFLRKTSTASFTFSSADSWSPFKLSGGGEAVLLSRGEAKPTNQPCERKPLICVAVPVLPKIEAGRLSGSVANCTTHSLDNQRPVFIFDCDTGSKLRNVTSRRSNTRRKKM